jgi:NADPH:quinone reductase-like Zn-dependent oxidoreductase
VPACAEGRDNQCVRYDVLGLQSDGGYAELVSVPAENLIADSAHVDFIDGGRVSADVPDGVAHARHAGGVRAGDVVLVLAGGSGVGQAAIQLARHFGARVFATSAPRRRIARARSAPKRCSITTRRLRARGARATGGRGADIVDRARRAGDVGRSVRALASGGRLVTCGATTGAAARSTCSTCSRGSCRSSALHGHVRRAARGRAAAVRGRVTP